MISEVRMQGLSCRPSALSIVVYSGLFCLGGISEKPTKERGTVKFQFIARCADQSMTLEVNIDYRPGKQMQRARRVAVGELLAALAIEEATIDAAGDERVVVTTQDAIWVIAEGGSIGERRGAI